MLIPLHLPVSSSLNLSPAFYINTEEEEEKKKRKKKEEEEEGGGEESWNRLCFHSIIKFGGF